MTNIREANLIDIQPLQRLMKETWLTTYPDFVNEIGINTANDILNEEFPVHKIEKAILSDTDYLIIAEDNCPIGYIQASFNIDNEVGDAIINKLYVDASYQRQKIGFNLYNALTKVFAKTDRNRIYVQVAEYNKKAINFYQKLGFSFSKKVLYNRYHDKDYFDLLMTKYL